MTLTAMLGLTRVQAHRTTIKNSCRFYRSTTGVFGFRPRATREPPSQLTINEVKSRLDNDALVNHVLREFRERGHLLARVNPIAPRTRQLEGEAATLLELLAELEARGSQSINGEIIYSGNGSSSTIELRNYLKDAYEGTMSAEFMHISNTFEREWFTKRFENIHHDVVSIETKKDIAKVLLESELFDHFVGAKLPTIKRYGGEGAETMLTFFDEVFKLSAEAGNPSDIVIGMPHRGRLNLLSGLLKFPAVILFRKMQGMSEFDLSQVDGTIGDVLSHLFTSVDLEYGNNSVHVSLLPNPSHLEAVSPMVCGKARGKELSKRVGSYGSSTVLESASPILPIQVHGDASFAGQGVVMELLNMSKVPHFAVDGSIHLIVNNQIGFTTPGEERGRSTRYCSDVLKMIEAPIIHVNGDCPEDVVRATRLAFEYRQQFKKDVAIDIVCFRKWGHNEIDDPTFTNPVMYDAINSRQSTMPNSYARKVLDEEEYLATTKLYNGYLAEQLQLANSYKPVNTNLQGLWHGLVHPSSSMVTKWDTGVDLDILRYVGIKSTNVNADFNLHPTLSKVLVKDRASKVQEGSKIDWATAEAMAFGSLLYQDFNVRISGQDVGRATFSHRHAMLVDQATGEITIPLNNLKPDQKGFLEIANSILSEEAGLAFEYGLSLDSPNNLVIWEAQFGDFFNGAQIMLDTLISSGELKWLLQSAITLLLPHGQDGAGPEHSSARIERFLQMSDSQEDAVDGDQINWTVANPTTPAQYFHLLRRQLVRNYRKPLVLIAPKVLLRHPAAVSQLNDFQPGTHFSPVLDDLRHPIPEEVRKVIFCSGKHFYALDKERTERGLRDVAIIRLEELCPFPAALILEQLQKYKRAKGN